MSDTNNNFETSQAEIEKAFADEISSPDAEINEVEDLTEDGGVLKKIIKEGDGFEKPLDGTEVNVRYVGTLLDGKEFDRSNEFKFVVGGNQVIKGWDITLRSMRLHEICTVTLKPEYAYGSTGAGGSIPPNATLVFEIELNSFSNEKDITKRKDGGIMKKIIVSSDEWKTPKYETEVEFKVIGRLNNGKVFQDEVKKITIGDEEVIPGIELALKTMKKGEKSLFEVSPSYGFGSEGNVDLGISGDSTLSFEIELLEMSQEEPYDIDDVDEKINGGNQRKEKGNSLFREGKFKRAIKTYRRAIKFCDYLSDATEEQKKKSEEIKVMCQLNQTQCFIKLKEFKKAKDLVDKVIEKDDSNKKAYYRRGSVLAELGEWKEAIKDFERCLAIDNDNTDAKREIEKLKKKIKAQDDKDRMMYSRIFKRM